MEFEMRKEPERITEKSVQNKLREFTSAAEPVPNILVLDGAQVSISDIRRAIIAFREQKWLLQRFGMLWPSVRLQSDPGNVEKTYWVPLDLSTYVTDSNVLEREIANGDALANAEIKARRAGFIIKRSSPDEMDDSFNDILGEVVHRRVSSTKDPNTGPPTNVFTVTTNSHGVQLLFAIGFFVSTQQGFGISTPASRHLPWGQYTFGYKQGSKVRFDNIVWKVPDVTNIHMKV